MKSKKVSYADLARYCNFSKTTISRYFSNPDSLTLENQEKIREAVETLGYQENKIAKILPSGHTEFIGLIIPNLYMPYYSEVMHHLLSSYSTYGYKFLVFEGQSDIELERKYIRELSAYNVEGIITLSHTISSKEYASYNIPIVAIEREDEFISSVHNDNYMGGIQATSLLYKSDCDILFFIDSTPYGATRSAYYSKDKHSYSYGRLNGFKYVCNEKNMPNEVIIQDLGLSYEEYSENIPKIIDDIAKRYPGKRKGIFCANDTFANISLLHLLRAYGNFPDDFRIVGYDGSPISAQAIIPFSTVGQQLDQITKSAMEILVSQIKAKHRRIPEELPIRHEVIAPILINRATTQKETPNIAGAK